MESTLIEMLLAADFVEVTWLSALPRDKYQNWGNPTKVQVNKHLRGKFRYTSGGNKTWVFTISGRAFTHTGNWTTSLHEIISELCPHGEAQQKDLDGLVWTKMTIKTAA